MKITGLPSLALAAALVAPVDAFAQGDSGPDSSVQWSDCSVGEVATFDNRVHVRCVESGWVVPFFASPTSSSAEAARLVTLGTAAMMGAGRLWILSDLRLHDAASYGCLVHDCRRPLQMMLRK
jgi:hypothetical protein